MKSYLIGYDLNKPGQDYTDLINAIKKLASGSWHCLDSTWIIKSDSAAVAIRDTLKPHLDSSDELLVMNVTGVERAWVGFDKECSDWLSNNV
jgi:hypothetical protein